MSSRALRVKELLNKEKGQKERERGKRRTSIGLCTGGKGDNKISTKKHSGLIDRKNSKYIGIETIHSGDISEERKVGNSINSSDRKVRRRGLAFMCKQSIIQSKSIRSNERDGEVVQRHAQINFRPNAAGKLRAIPGRYSIPCSVKVTSNIVIFRPIPPYPTRKY